jgi:hypothetical protein
MSYKLENLKIGDRLYSIVTGWITINEIKTVGNQTYLYDLKNNLIDTNSPAYFGDWMYIKIRDTDKRIFSFS